MSQFYHVTNCTRTIRAGKHSINFTPYEHTGCWLGVHETSDPSEIAVLDELVNDKKSGVTSITQEEYNHAVKKKKAASQGYTQSLATSAPTPGEAAASSAEQVIDTNPPAVPVEMPTPLESVKDAVTVVKVESKKAK